jgi:hypothetical protein
VYFNDLTARRELQKVIGMAQNITIGSWLDHALVSFAGGCFVHLLRSDSGTQGVSLIRLGAQNESAVSSISCWNEAMRMATRMLFQ